MLATLLSVVLAATQVSPSATATAGPGATAAPPAPVKEKGFDALAVPLVSFNSDDGAGIGIAGGAYFYRPGAAPYAHGIGVQFYATKRGVQNHFLRYDGPNFLGSKFRVEGRLELRKELRSPFYGEGNEAAPGITDFEHDPTYQYNRRAWGGWARARYQPIGPLLGAQPYFGYGFHDTSVKPPPGSLVAMEQPVGVEGGNTGQVLLGVLWDTRDEEADPTRGGLEEVSLRMGGKVTGSDFNYGEVTVAERRFVDLGNRIILGGRLLGDHLFGDVPFFELANIGGISPTDGLGGISSIRGLPRNRYVGRTKVLLNSELRYTFLETPILHQVTRFGGVGFADLGRVWSPDVEDGPWYRFHPGVGLGLRIVRRAAAVRFDYGVSEDRQSIYLTFGQVF